MSDLELIIQLHDDCKKLQAENAFLKENINGTKMKQMNDRIEELLAENKKMREALEVVLGYDGDFLSTSAEVRLNTAKYAAEQALKEVGEE